MHRCGSNVNLSIPEEKKTGIQEVEDRHKTIRILYNE
jgi:hypothetical protein